MVSCDFYCLITDTVCESCISSKEWNPSQVMGEKWAACFIEQSRICSLQKYFKAIVTKSLFCIFKVKYKQIRIGLNEIYATVDKILIY